MDPGFFLGHVYAARAYAMKGEYAAALAGFTKVMELIDDPNYLAFIVHVHAVSGKRDDALKALEQMKQMAGTGRYVSPHSFALAYAGLGDKDKALEYLERSFETRDTNFSFIDIDPYLKDLRSDPRFKDLVRRAGLPE